ncbi:MAG: sulfite exporter TauE/SafE family protein [Microbacteriaceae bacterium]|nr:sulfite exporter TauE/SafE family protein [Microbacteriaceae bacterium]
MHGITELLFLAIAGVVAGVIGTAGGVASLVSYPALLAVGLPPLAANVTNSVALLGSGFSSALRAAPDIRGHSHTLRVWLPPTMLLSLGGAALLLVTPSGVFDHVVPFLVAFGSLALLLQPVIAAGMQRAGNSPPSFVIALSGAAVAMYNGYFGAGSGILMMVLLLLSTEPLLYRANALKNVILFAANILPTVLFALLGTVIWHAVWPLAIGLLAGGLIGPSIARRVPAAVLRVLIGICGLGLAVYLFVTA